MRILHLITELEVGGAEKLLADTLPRLDRARFEIQVVFLHGSAPLQAPLERAGIPVLKLDTRGKFDLAAFGRLVRLLRQQRIELLHTHLIQADLMGYFAARRAGVSRIVSTKHNTHYFQSHAAWLPRLDSHVNRRLTCLVAVSESVKQYYVRTQRLDPSRMVVIPNGIELDRFQRAEPARRAALGMNESHRLVCCVGNLKEKKGHRVLLESWPSVLRTQPLARLLLVGEGPLRGELEQQASARGIRDSVHFLGARDDIPGILKASDLFVLPSLWEGFGIAIVEAMAAGLPVVATAVDGVREIVRDGEDGLLVPPNDPHRLSAAVAELLGDPQRAQSLAAAGRSRAARFSIQATVAALERLYEELRLRPARARPGG